MISHLNNHGASARTAAIDLDSEIWSRAPSVLTDAGFKIVGSLRSPAHSGIIRLVIRGSALPEQCETAFHLVRMAFNLESYGEQKIVRIQTVEIVGNPLSPSEAV